VRIVSLSPAATEIIVALGLDDHLVGVTRRCDWPPEVVGTRLVTSPRSSPEVDEEALRAARPDLVIVIAADGSDPADHRRLIESARSVVPDATIVALDPMSIEGILNAISTVGAMTSAEDAALELVESLRARLGRSRSRSRLVAPMARPPFGSRLSGGSIRRPPSGAGSPSRSVERAGGTCSHETGSRRPGRAGRRCAMSIPRCSS
jgi:iron complex transport system substrate-binding protein